MRRKMQKQFCIVFKDIGCIKLAKIKMFSMENKGNLCLERMDYFCEKVEIYQF